MEMLVRKPVQVKMHISDGSILSGVIIISRDTRLSDVLNNIKKDFIVLLDDEKKPHIINKRHIVKILEAAEEEFF